MSNLENSAKPLIIPMILGTFRGTLTGSNLVTLSRWIWKTVLVLSTASNYRRVVPLQHFEHLYTQGEPTFGVGIRIAEYEGPEPFYWMQGQLWVVEGQELTPAKIDKVQRGSYKTSFQFGRFLCSAHYLCEPWPIVEHFDGATQIWPSAGKRVKWPPRRAYNEIVEFHMSPKVILRKSEPKERG